MFMQFNILRSGKYGECDVYTFYIHTNKTYLHATLSIATSNPPFRPAAFARRLGCSVCVCVCVCVCASLSLTPSSLFLPPLSSSLCLPSSFSLPLSPSLPPSLPPSLSFSPSLPPSLPPSHSLTHSLSHTPDCLLAAHRVAPALPGLRERLGQRETRTERLGQRETRTEIGRRGEKGRGGERKRERSRESRCAGSAKRLCSQGNPISYI